ncbi:Xaa-Pro peptidase family protein [Thalassotalea sp. 1_MG-2023]|uniref:M24 family metallopeptidase n=1 Tax=Thalassotalea sp. 1_MG-2023 TaxID=3062680 RepID=UPI0026E22615|nr:Xaa-Pro peptidase family protein [Thalassotalea sp. 1_MG-2023]MDO6426963.1 Xaa-Pro peptidase family protein [Thalassotalea sp. 1_MG-2023]
MTIGIGGSTAEIELEKLKSLAPTMPGISIEEYQARINKATELMSANNIDAVYLNAGTNLHYFTGTKWYASERLVGALLTKNGSVTYIAPHFEIDTLRQHMVIEGNVQGWHEHESPFQCCVDTLSDIVPNCKTLAIDESTAFFISNGIQKVANNLELIDAKPVTAGCRMQKSDHEIAILQTAMNMTLEVHKAVAKILRVGITTQEVEAFIDQAHRAVGATSGSYFCIVLFGQDSSYPHGVKTPKSLEQNDMVLIDTGYQLHGYNSDITRSYVFGEATDKQRKMWQVEKDAQIAAFNAAHIGKPCGVVDIAARDFLTSQGLGPDYQTPGCPHRTGHGIGLDIHEWPYLVRSEQTPLARGMCFSNEPMLVFPQEFGIRLEDHFYMTEQGAKWFTEPAHSISNPFGYPQSEK